MLAQAMAKDLTRRGVRAAEAFGGDRRWESLALSARCERRAANRETLRGVLTGRPIVTQMYSASSRSSADFGLAPTICLTTWPPENTLMVGMAMIP